MRTSLDNVANGPFLPDLWVPDLGCSPSGAAEGGVGEPGVLATPGIPARGSATPAGLHPVSFAVGDEGLLRGAAPPGLLNEGVWKTGGACHPRLTKWKASGLLL